MTSAFLAIAGSTTSFVGAAEIEKLISKMNVPMLMTYAAAERLRSPMSADRDARPLDALRRNSTIFRLAMWSAHSVHRVVRLTLIMVSSGLCKSYFCHCRSARKDRWSRTLFRSERWRRPSVARQTQDGDDMRGRLSPRSSSDRLPETKPGAGVLVRARACAALTRIVGLCREGNPCVEVVGKLRLKCEIKIRR